MRTLIVLLAFATAGAVDVLGQSPPSSSAAPPAFAQTPSPPSSGAAPPAPAANFEYAADGRRDPFVSLVNRGTDTGAGQPGRTRPDGPAGVMVDEVVVRGIVQSRDGWIAMVAAPNGRTYSIRPGDSLLDGSVHSITSQVVVLMQDVNEPLSRLKQREVRKYLREEVK